MEQGSKGNPQQRPPVRIFRRVTPVTIGPELGDARLSEIDNRYFPTSMALYPHGVRGIQELCDANAQEIMARQESIRFLTDDRHGITLRQDVATAHRSNSHETLPDNATRFLEYALGRLPKGETRFWDMVHQAEQTLRGMEELPVRIRELWGIIANEGDARLAEERQLADDMVRDMRKAATCRGVIRFVCEPTSGYRLKGNGCTLVSDPYGNESFVGRYYHPTENDPAMTKQRSPLKQWLDNTNFGRRRQRRLIERASRIKHIPPEIENDVKAWLDEQVRKAAFVNGNPERVETEGWHKLVQRCEKIKAEIMEITVAFQFDDTGLSVEVVKVEIQANNRADAKVNNFPQYIEILSPRDASLQAHYHRLQLTRYRERLAASFEKLIVGQNHDWTQVPSPKTDERFSRGYFPHAYRRFWERIEQVQNWQAWVTEAFNDFVIIDHVTNQMEQQPWYGRMGHRNYCWPQVLDTTQVEQTSLDVPNIFEATNIRPFRPVGDCVIPEPFSGLSMNSELVDLTGRNGSGKSTLEMTVLDFTLFAQCGFYVPARVFKFTPKQYVLFSFLERATNESTVVRKFRIDRRIAELVRGMNDAERAKTLVILDEVGSATTQSTVIPVAFKYISFLRRCQVCVLASTQIPELSAMLEQQLKAQNLRITENYVVEPGIGEGEPQEVAAAVGLMAAIA